MNVRFPTAPAVYSMTYGNQLITALHGYFNRLTANDEETPRVILRSPNGTLYDLTVSDAGVLVVTPTSKARA